MKGKIQCLHSSQELLANVVYSPDHALARNFGAESYVPKNARKGKNEALVSSKIRQYFVTTVSLFIMGQSPCNMKYDKKIALSKYSQTH